MRIVQRILTRVLVSVGVVAVLAGITLLTGVRL